PGMATPRRRTGVSSGSAARRSMALTIQSAPAASASIADEPGLSSCSSIRSGASSRSRSPCRFAASGPRKCTFHETTRTGLSRDKNVVVLDLDQGGTVGMAHARDVHETPILGLGPEPRIARSAPGFFFEGLGSAGLEYRVLTPPDASPTCAAWLISRVFT